MSKRKNKPIIPQKTRDAIERKLLDGKEPNQIIKSYRGRYRNQVHEIKRRLIDTGRLLS